ncbi:hypothetical protein H9P43_002476 [Blastocladiella emersonii ATCC 22665]|nr:hypothetical protein H9P43_002476 [Blastocladiella emersonii ATCC 22665]
MQSEVLIGLLEYGLWSTLARLVLVGLITNATYQLFLVPRPGLALAMQLSLTDGLKMVGAYAKPRLTRAPRKVLLAVGLALIALSAKLGDYVATSYFTNSQARNSVRVAWVRQTNDLVRKFVPDSYLGLPVPRIAVVDILSVIAGKYYEKVRQSSVWLRTYGAFTEADLAAQLLVDADTDGKHCGSNIKESFAASNISTFLTNLTYFGPTGRLRLDDPMRPQLNVFGLELYPMRLQFGHATGSYYTVAVPVPVGYAGESSSLEWNGGRNVADMAKKDTSRGSQSSSRVTQHGVLNDEYNLVGYEIECGLTPSDVNAWIDGKAADAAKSARKYGLGFDFRTSGSNVSASTLQLHTSDVNLAYLDMSRWDNLDDDKLYSNGRHIAMLASVDPAMLGNGTTEFLTFASTSVGDTRAVRLAAHTVSDAIEVPALFRQANGQSGMYVTSTGIALTEKPKVECAKTTGSTARYDVSSGKPQPSDADTVAARSNPFDWSKSRGFTADPEKCTLALKGVRDSTQLRGRVGPADTAAMTYYGAAQVCRVRLQKYEVRGFKPADGTARETYASLITAVEAVPVTGVNEVEVRCLPRVDGKPKATPGQFGALLSNLFGDDTAAWVRYRLIGSNTGGLLGSTASTAYESWEDPDGPQSYSRTLIRVPVWHFIAFVAVLVISAGLAYAGFGSIFDLVMSQVYAFAYLPGAAPANSHARDGEDDDKADANCLPTAAGGTSDIDIMQKATLALVEIPDALANGHPTRVIRLVPVSDRGEPVVYSPASESAGPVLATSARYATVHRRAQALDKGDEEFATKP